MDGETIDMNDTQCLEAILKILKYRQFFWYHTLEMFGLVYGA